MSERIKGLVDRKILEASWPQLVKKLEAIIESDTNLGFDIGEGLEVVDFLASLQDMDTVESLLGDSFSADEREFILNHVEEAMADPKNKKK